MEDQQTAGIVLNNCTIIIHIGKPKDFNQLVRELVEEGIISPRVAEQLLGKDTDDA